MSAPANPTSKQRIYDLLDGLPPESLETVEGFVRLLREQIKHKTAETARSDVTEPFRYPTVSLPLHTLDGLIGMMPSVGGDALAETEALYDVEPRA